MNMAMHSPSPRPDAVDSANHWFPSSLWSLARVIVYRRAMGIAQTVTHQLRQSAAPEPPTLPIPEGLSKVQAMPYQIQAHAIQMEAWRQRVSSQGQLDPILHSRLEPIFKSFRLEGMPSEIKGPTPLLVISPAQHLIQWLRQSEEQIMLRPGRITGAGATRSVVVPSGPTLMLVGAIEVTHMIDLDLLPVFPVQPAPKEQTRFHAEALVALNETYALAERIDPRAPIWTPVLVAPHGEEDWRY